MECQSHHAAPVSVVNNFAGQKRQRTAPSPSNETVRPHILVLAVKSHEHTNVVNMFSKHLGRFQRGPDVHTDNYSGTTFDNHAMSVSVYTLSGLSGPVNTAIILSYLVSDFEKTEKPITHAMMVGIAGGLKLGEVLCPLHIISPNEQRVVRVEGDTPAVEGDTPAVEGGTPAVEGAPPAIYYKQADEDEHKLQVKATALKLDQFKVYLEETNVGFEKAVFLCYESVRDDVAVIISDHKKNNPLKNRFEYGLEMEASAFYRTLEVLKIRPLPVFKAVSDCGAESLENGTTYAKHNQEVYQKEGLSPDNSAARKQYRKIACKKAAQVAMHYIKFWKEHLLPSFVGQPVAN